MYQKAQIRGKYETMLLTHSKVEQKKKQLLLICDFTNFHST